MLEIVKEKLVAAIIAAVVSSLVGAIFAWLNVRRNQKRSELDEIRTNVKQLEETDEMLRTAIRAILRKDIINAYDKYTQKGWAPVYVKDNVQEMYESYHNLGGNGTVTHLMGEFMELPTRKEDLP